MMKSNTSVFLWQSYALFFVLVGLFGVGVTPTQAASFNVSTAAELIAAIQTANGNSEADVIDLGGNTIELTAANVTSILGDIGLPIITSEITFQNGTIRRSNSAPEFRIMRLTGTVTLNNITIENGLLTGEFHDGGGISSTGTLTIRNSIIRNNVAGRNAGAIYNGGDLTIVNSLIVGNVATAGNGGATINFGTSLNITNSTIADNTASGSAGGVLFEPFNISNSILWGNSGTDLSAGSSPIAVFSATYSIVQGGFAGTGNLNVNPLFVNSVGGDYSLSAFSPAIDKADSTLLPGGITLDLAGNTRQVNDAGLANNPSTLDRGAYEFQGTSTYTASISATTPTATFSPLANGQFTVTLDRANATGAAVTVNYSVAGTAVAGTDYTTLTGSVSIANGAQTATINVAPLQASFVNKTVQVTLTGTSNATVGISATPATVTINASTPATISATTANATFDPLSNGQFTVDLGIVNTTGSAITVNYSVGGTATAGTDYTTLTGSVSIANGAQTATIDVVPLLASLVDKTVQVTLTSASNAAVNVNTTPATVTIDASSASIALSVNADTVLENGGNQTAQIVYTGAPLQAGQQVDFTLTRADVTTSAADFNGTPIATNGSFIAGGATTIDMDTAIFDDVIVEANEQYTLTLGGLATTPGGLPVTIGAINVQTVTITDDETPNVHVNPVAHPIVVGTSNTSYAIVLTTEPFADVTVTITPDNAICATSPTNLTFTPADWNTPQTVIVTVSGVIGSACVISHTATGGGYDAVVIPDVNVSVIAPPLNPGTGTSAPQLILSGLSVAGVQGQGTPRPGENALWQFSIFNNTGSPVNGLTARVTYPDDDMQGISATSSTGVNGTFSQGSLLADFNLGTIGAGETITLNIVTRLPNRAGIFNGTLSVNASGDSTTLSLLTVGQLPATGETPPWIVQLRQLLGVD